MIAKCVNPACGTPFRYLRGGRLYLVDFPAAAAEMTNPNPMTNGTHFSEFFWLCEECCQSMQIVVEKSGDVILLAGSERQTVCCKSAVSGTGIAEVLGSGAA